MKLVLSCWEWWTLEKWLVHTYELRDGTSIPDSWGWSFGASCCIRIKGLLPQLCKEHLTSSAGCRIPLFLLSACREESAERSFQTLQERSKSRLVSSPLSHGVADHKIGWGIWKDKKTTLYFKIQRRCPLRWSALLIHPRRKTNFFWRCLSLNVLPAAQPSFLPTWWVRVQRSSLAE